MPESETPRAWLLLAAGDERQFGGNHGYDDQADLYYTWDSTVPNHKAISEGDIVAVWDKHRLLGVSVVEEIARTQISKDRLRCPNPECGRTNIQPRASKLPIYKCQRCKHEFDDPIRESIPVVEYRSRHDAAWTWLDGALDGAELRDLCWSPRSQHSMRSLNWLALSSKLAARGGQTAVERALSRAIDSSSAQPASGVVGPHGHSRAFVRVRRGQTTFRESLLRQFGGNCAFTGAAPERALEAGHLYSYASLGVHHEYGGLLLRRDVHRLFDDGWLAVNPESLTVDVSTHLAPYSQYARLHDAALCVDLRSEHVDWLGRHWQEHRENAYTVSTPG